MVVTIYQQEIVWSDAEANRKKAEEKMAGVAGRTDLFVMPETFSSGFGDHMAQMAEAEDGQTLRWAKEMAARHGMLIVGSWIVAANGRYYNRLHWVYPDGSYGHYDKAHLFRGSEAEQMSKGTERPTFEYKGWRIRPAVCYDLRFPTWLRNKELDYDMLIVCANWPTARREVWTTLLKARAIENMCYVVGCNRSGEDINGTDYSGDSLMIDYKGKEIASVVGEPRDATVDATIDKEKMEAFRQRWPFNIDFD